MTINFIILVLSLTFLVILTIGYFAIKSRGEIIPKALPETSIYKYQLEQIKIDLNAGKITTEEYENHNIEISRRLLRSSRSSAAEILVTTKSSNLIASLCFLFFTVFTISGSGALYLTVGGNGLTDQPLASRQLTLQNEIVRLSQSEAEAESFSDTQTNLPEVNSTKNTEKLTRLVFQLKKILQDRPNDLKGHKLLVENSVRLGDFVTAYQAQNTVISILEDDASSVDYGNYAELLIIAANGYVSPKAEKALTASLKSNKKNQISLYYYGLLMLQNEKPQIAFNIWEQLVIEGPQDAPWIVAINSQLSELENQFDIRGSSNVPQVNESKINLLSEEKKAPSVDMDMIYEMVESLSERIYNDGGSLQDWKKLIKSYGVLGKKDKVKEALKDATTIFAADPEKIEELNKIARSSKIFN